MVCSIVVNLTPLPFRISQKRLIHQRLREQLILELETLLLMNKKKRHSIQSLLRIGEFMLGRMVDLNHNGPLLLLHQLTVNKQLPQFHSGLNQFNPTKNMPTTLIQTVTTITSWVVTSFMEIVLKPTACSSQKKMLLLT